MNLHEYVTASKADSNLWWRLSSGTQLNLLDEAIEENELYGSMKEGVAQRIGDLEREIERLVGELKHQRQRADDGADQFHWLAEWCRTQFTVDNNAVIGRDGWPRRLVEVVAKAVDVEIERLRGDRECLTRWFLARVVDGYHGCVSGDCPHLKEAECVAAILEHFDEEQAAKAAGGDDAS